MSEDSDSWFRSAFGVDLVETAGRIKNEVVAAAEQAQTAVSQAVGGAQAFVEDAVDGVTSAAVGIAKKVSSVVTPSVAPTAGAGGSAGGGTGSLPIAGSVGRGGRNAASDVRAVQSALGIASDGQCGNATIAAIESFQRAIGQAKPDGRIDPGGATERALMGGAGGLAGALRSQITPTPFGSPGGPLPMPPEIPPEMPMPSTPGQGGTWTGFVEQAKRAAPEVAKKAGIAGRIFTAATPVGAAGFVAGLAGPYLIAKAIEHAKEVEARGDPDLRSLPGGAPPQQAPSGLPTDPAADPLDGGAPAQAPGAAGAEPMADPGAPDPVVDPDGLDEEPLVFTAEKLPPTADEFFERVKRSKTPVVFRNLSLDVMATLKTKYGCDLAFGLQSMGTIGSYAAWQIVVAGCGGNYQAHHIVEQKILTHLGYPVDQCPAVILTAAEHIAVSKILAIELPPGDIGEMKRKEILDGYEKAYKDHPYWMREVRRYFR